MERRWKKIRVQKFLEANPELVSDIIFVLKEIPELKKAEIKIKYLMDNIIQRCEDALR